MALEAEVRAKGASKLAGMQAELDQAQVRPRFHHILPNTPTPGPVFAATICVAPRIRPRPTRLPVTTRAQPNHIWYQPTWTLRHKVFPVTHTRSNRTMISLL